MIATLCSGSRGDIRPYIALTQELKQQSVKVRIVSGGRFCDSKHNWPFPCDKFAWAHRSFDIGIGAKPICKKNFSAESPTAAIGYALSGKVVTKAKRLGEFIWQEKGVRDCAKVIINSTRGAEICGN